MSALSLPPENSWLEWFGLWSTFAVSIGTPPVTSSVLFSTSLPVHYLQYNTSASSTYTSSALQPIPLEGYLGYTFTGYYGHDNFTLLNGTDNVLSSDVQYFGSIFSADDTNNGYESCIGLRPQETYLDSPTPQILQTLKNQSVIPSISWGYNAGSYRRSFLASLTLGGYDAEKMGTNGISYPMNGDGDNYLIANLTSISITDSKGTPQQTVFSTPASFSLDANLPYMWLPEDVCDAIASRLSLIYNSTYDLYLVNDTDVNGIVGTSPADDLYNNITAINFSFADNTNASHTMTISQQFYEYWWYGQPTNSIYSSVQYFPMKRAANSSQYVLGRTFFQGAYLLADFERQNFTLAPRLWTNSTNLVNVEALPVALPTNTSSGSNSTSTGNDTSSITGSSTSSNNSGSKGLSGGAIAGIVIGAVAGLAILGLIAFFMLRRRKNNKKVLAAAAAADEKNGSYAGWQGRPSADLQAEEAHEMPSDALLSRGPSELPTSPVLSELPTSAATSELPGSSMQRVHDLQVSHPVVRHELAA